MRSLPAQLAYYVDKPLVIYLNQSWYLSWKEKKNHSVKKMQMETSSAKCQSFRSSLNSSPLSATYMCQWIGSALVQIMACRLFSAKPLSKPMLGYCQFGPLGTNFSEILIKILNFSFMKMHLKIWSAKRRPFCPGGDVLTWVSKSWAMSPGDVAMCWKQ